METNKRLLKNTFWLLGGKGASGIFNALQIIIVARALGVKEYGLMVLVIAYVDILNKLFDFRVWETATKYIGTYLLNRQYEKVRAMVKLSYLIDISSGIIAFIIVIGLAKIANKLFINSTGAETYIYIYSLSLLIDTSNRTSDAILRVFDKFSVIAYTSSFVNFFKLVTVSITLYLGFGIKGVLFAYILSSIVGLIIRVASVSIYLNRMKIRKWWKSNIRTIKDQWREIGWFLGNTSLNGTLVMAGDNHLGILALGYFAGGQAAAYYKVAKSILKIIMEISNQFYLSIYPELVKMLSAETISKIKESLKYMTKKLLLITLPLTIIIILFPETVLKIFYGKDYIEASLALQIIAATVILSQPIFWANPLLLALGRAGVKNVINISSTMLYLLLLFSLVEDYTFVGAAWAYLGYHISITLLSLVFVKRYLKKECEKKSVV